MNDITTVALSQGIIGVEARAHIRSTGMNDHAPSSQKVEEPVAPNAPTSARRYEPITERSSIQNSSQPPMNARAVYAHWMGEGSLCSHCPTRSFSSRRRAR